MPDNFPVAIASLLDHEGSRLVPDDHGRGPSKYGITFKTAHELGFVKTPDEIAALTPERSEQFYQLYFWQYCGLWRITDQALSTKLLDLSANEGQETTIMLLQQAVNALAEMLTVKVDGILGPMTAQAVNALDPESLLQALRERAAEHYERIVAADPSEQPNLAGWLARLAS